MTNITVTINADSAEELKEMFKGLAGAAKAEPVKEAPKETIEAPKITIMDARTTIVADAPKPEPKKRSPKKKEIEAHDMAEETLAFDAPEPAKEEAPKEEPVSAEPPVKEEPPKPEPPKELTEEMKVELRTMVAKYIHAIPDGKDRVKQFLKGKNLSKVTELDPSDVEEFKALLAC